MSRSSRVRVWFGLAPMLPPTEWRYDLRQTWNASHMTWRTEASGCVDLPDAYGEVCTCPPARETGISSLSEGYGYAHFGPLYPELTLQLPSAIEHSSTVTFQCVDPRGDGVGGGIGTSISGVENVLSASAGTTDGAFFVAPTGCVGPDGRVTPDCSAHPELYAAIPFVGSDQRRDVSTSSSRQTKMRWEVCCGCGVPPRDMPEGETDPCGDPDQQRGLLEVAVDRAKALRAEATPHLQRFEREYGQAQQFKSDFDLVVNSCAGWDIAMALLAFLAGGPNAPQSAQAFTQGLGMLQQVLARDPSVVLSAGAAFGLEGWDVVNDSWGLMSTLYTGALDASSAGSLPGMKAKLEDCARVPLVSRLVYDDAKLYLQHLETAFTELRELHRLSTLAQQADTQVIEKWHAYHRACLENAACRGIDPAVCGPAPP